MRSMPSALWHTLPLHYVPYLLYTGALCAQAELRRRGYPVRPRPTAARRDRKLHLDDYVHLSPAPVTPLLRDKCARGYPHALIAFDADLLAEEGVALCRFNAKAWRHRDDFAPVTDGTEKAEVWSQWCVGQYPSLELLIPGALPLAPHAQGLSLPDEWAREWVASFGGLLGDAALLPCQVTPAWFPGLAGYNGAGLTDYLRACEKKGELLGPPDLPFD